MTPEERKRFRDIAYHRAQYQVLREAFGLRGTQDPIDDIVEVLWEYRELLERQRKVAIGR